MFKPILLTIYGSEKRNTILFIQVWRKVVINKLNYDLLITTYHLYY